MFFRTVGQKAEVADAHEPIRQDMEQKAADKLLGIEGHGLFAIAIFSISIAQGDFSLIAGEDAIIRQRHAVGVAAEIIEHGLGRTEGFFRIDNPILVVRHVDVAVDRWDFSSSMSLP